MVADIKSLIGAVHDNRILLQSQLFERGGQFSHAVIHAPHAAKIVFGVPLILPADQIFSGRFCRMKCRIIFPIGGPPFLFLLRRHPPEIIASRSILPLLDRIAIELCRQIDEQVVVQIHVSIDLHLLMPSGWCVILPSVKERCRLRKRLIAIEINVVKGGHPVAMGRFVLAHQQKGAVRIAALLEPVDRQLGHDLRAVSFDHLLAIRRNELGIVIRALPGKNLPGVETLRSAFQMPLAEQGGLVSALLQQLWKGALVRVEAIAVVHKAIFMAMFAGENHRPARTADRIGAETVFKEHPLTGEPIDVGSGVDRFVESVICANRVRCMIVRKDEQDVRANTAAFLVLLANGNLCAGQCRQGGEQDEDGMFCSTGSIV